MRITVYIISWIVVASIFTGTFAGCSENRTPEGSNVSERPAVRVSVMIMSPESIRDLMVLPGETEPFEDVRLASDLDGLVEWIGPAEGDAVTAGKLIAKIEVSALKAALDSAEASFKLAESQFQRRKELFDRGAAAQEEFDRSKTEYDLAESTLRRARVEYKRGFLVAPARGLVNKVYVDVGEYVGRGAPVIDLVDIDKIKVNVSVPEIDVRYLKEGQHALVKIDALPAMSFEGIIDFVAYKADQVTKTFQTRIILENADRVIRPGMIARATFLRRNIRNTLAVPLAALVDKGGERIVFVVKDGIAHARTVSIGIINGERIQIVEGLEKGDHVVVIGQTEIEEGMRVQVQ